MAQHEGIGLLLPGRRSGFAYVAVLLFVAVLTALGLSLLSRAGIGTSSTLQRGFTIQAGYLAEAAVNHGMWRLLNEPGFPPAEDTYYMHDLAGGRYGYMVRRHTDSTFAAIAAVGTIGESVVRRSYVLRLLGTGSTARMATGTYVGNGVDNRSIGDVGFQPDVVIIKGDLKKNAVIRTSSMQGDLSKKMKGASVAAANMIQSLDPTGFTVGTHRTVNRNGKNYYWAAFRALEDRMAVGTYTGDGSSDRAITGMCFTPALVIVFSEQNREAVFRIDYSPDCFDFNNGTAENNCILDSFLTDGFRVGKNNRVNKSGETYHYVCWPSVSGQQVSGGYTGDGSDDRDITGLGLKPEYLFVRCISSGENMVHRTASLGAGDTSMFFAATKNAPNRVQALLADGFQIGKDRDVNKNNEDYEYFAWAKP